MRAKGGPDSFEQRSGTVLAAADDRDLDDPCQMEVQRPEQMREAPRVLDGDRPQQTQDADGVLFVGRVAGQPREPQQRQGGGGVTRRDRRVIEILATRDQHLVVTRGGEEATPFGVREPRDHRVRERTASSYQRCSKVAS